MCVIPGIEFAADAFRAGIPFLSVSLKCRTWCGNPELARQLAEDASAEAYRRSLLEKFHDEGHYHGWITKTAINVAIDTLRRRSFLRGLDQDIEQPNTTTASIDSRAETLRKVFERLPVQDLLLIQLTYFDGFTLDEIATKILSDEKGSLNAKRLKIKRRRDAALQNLRLVLDRLDLKPEDFFE